jgi:tetratricopeptide (TPR) repeat protein
LKSTPASFLCAFLLGCGGGSAANAPANVEVMRREQTPDKLFERGLAFAEIGDLTRAEQYLVAALDRGAPPRRALPALLRVCIAATRHRAAIVYAREYGASLSSDTQFDFILALLESAVGETESAIAHLRSSVHKAPDHAEAHYQLALLLERQETNEDSEIAFHLREYVRLDPQGSHAEEARTALKDLGEDGPSRIVPPASQ